MVKIQICIFITVIPHVLFGTIDYDVPVHDLTYSIEMDNGYHHIVLPGSFSMSEPGFPDLPVVTYSYVLPRDTRCAHVDIIDAVWEEVPGIFTVYPQQQMVPVYEDAGFTPPDPDVYGVDHYYPHRILAQMSSGAMRGYQICQFGIIPFKYYPTTGKLHVLTRLSVRFTTEPTGSSVAPRRQTQRAASLTKRVIASSIVNKSVVNQIEVRPLFYTEENTENRRPTELPSVLGAPVDLLIITTEAQRDAYDQFARDKKRCGYNTAVRTVSWIKQHYAGIDNAERVRSFIKDAVEKWGVVYVLLGGTEQHVPTRSVWMPPMYDQWPVSLVTDLYYSDLDGNWNADGDGLFGEHEDSLDFLPDVFVSRLPTDNGYEVLDYRDKVAAYLNPDDPVAFERVLFYTSDFDVANDAYAMAQRLAAHLPSYLSTTYLNNRPLAELKAAIHDGYGVILGIGHGDINNIRVRNSPRENATNYFFDSLTNYDAAALMVVITCYTSTFQGNCLAQHWVMNPSGGGIGYVGPSSFSEAYLHERYIAEQFDSLFSFPLAGVLARAKIPFVANSQWHNWYRLYQFSINLLGDPTVTLWDSIPLTYTDVTVSPDTVMVGYDTLTIIVDPVVDFTIVLSKDDDLFVLDSASSGMLQRQVKTESSGYVHYLIKSNGYVAHRGSLFVLPRDPYVVYAQHEIVDTAGNANGVINPGEEILLFVTLHNAGGSTASDINARLLCSDTFSTMIIDTASFANIAAGQQAGSLTPFRFLVSDYLPDEHALDFEVSLAYSAVMSNDSFQISAYAPQLAHFGQEFERVSDTVVIVPYVVNHGHSSADSVHAVVSAYSDTVVVLDSVVVFPMIAPQEIIGSQDDSLVLFCTYPSGEVRYNYRVYHRGTEIIDEEIMLAIPPAVDSLWVIGTKNAVVLEWASLPGAVGYRVYRALSSGGPFVFVKNHLVPICQYEDTDVWHGQEYYYYVTSVDVSMNQGSASDTVAGRLNPPFATGWPQMVYDYLFSSPNFGDLDPFYPGLEIVVCGKEGNIYAWHCDGTSVIGDGRIYTVSPAEIWCSPALGDVNADGSLEIVFGNRTSTNNLYVINNQGSCLPGWPHSTSGRKIGSPVLADLDGDKDLEIIVWNIHADLYVLHHDATGVFSKDGLLKDLPGIAFGTPAVGDITGDGDLEIVCCGGSGGDSLYVWDRYGNDCSPFPIYVQSGGLTYSTVLGDVCGDERPEICFYTDYTDQVYLVSADGSILWFKDVIDVADIEGCPVIADITGDDKPEIICSFKSGMTVFDSLGNVLDGFPDRRHDAKLPIVCDVDHGSDVEIIVGSKDWYLYAYKQNGQQASAFPIRLDNRIESSPAVFDIDADGKLELMTSSNDYFFYVYDLETEDAVWPRFKYDPYNSGLYGSKYLPGITTSENNSVYRFGFIAKPTVFVHSTVIELSMPAHTRVLTDVCVLDIYDAAGRLVKQFELPLSPTPRQSITWNGEDDTGHSVSAGVYFVRFDDGTHTQVSKIIKVK